MRIISRFHDYYDAVQKQGMDKDCVYIRETKEIEIEPTFKLGYQTHSSRDRYETRYHLLGYCGQIIFVHEIIDHELITREFKFNPPIPKPEKKRWSWTFDKRQEFLDQNLSEARELFHKYQVPIFLLTGKRDSYRVQRLILNPNLKAIDFMKFKDSYTAYQDIFQYVGGVLNQREKKMIQLTDIDKRDKHGFDKFSFKRLSFKKK